MKSLEDLKKLREQALKKVEMREGGKDYRVVVGMATCGIAAGARPVLNKLVEEYPDIKDDWDYIEHVKEIFSPYNTEFYYVELIAPQEIRLQRNATKNRLNHKPSKRDISLSNQRLINDDKNYRCVSFEGEITFDNYLRIDNSNKRPEEVAKMIKKEFDL